MKAMTGIALVVFVGPLLLLFLVKALLASDAAVRLFANNVQQAMYSLVLRVYERTYMVTRHNII